MIYHDPSEYVRGLQQLLVSDKKKIAFLFGAGTSLAKKNAKSLNIPAIGVMTAKIEAELSIEPKFKNAILEIKEEIGEEKYTIETLLSMVEQKKLVVGKGKLNNLDSTDFNDLGKGIKEKIKSIVKIHTKSEKNLENVIHVDFADWLGKSDRKYPVEIFTTNYDYLFELGLESKNIPFYDGFSGSYKPFFNPDSIEDLNFLPRQTKLWKIHGSLGWHYDQKNRKVWRKDSDDEDILIYPSTLKYDESRKQPYIAFGDRLSNFLKQPDTILITCGYSFGDEHINERIISALNVNPLTHVYALYYDILWSDSKKSYSLTADSKLSKLAKSNTKISLFGTRAAVIGGKYGDWKLKREPSKDDTPNVNKYYDEDFDLNQPKGFTSTGGEKWTGSGELFLPDFAKFTIFLQSMIPKNRAFDEIFL